jgi:hypothetical protein
MTHEELQKLAADYGCTFIYNEDTAEVRRTGCETDAKVDRVTSGGLYQQSGGRYQQSEARRRKPPENLNKVAPASPLMEAASRIHRLRSRMADSMYGVAGQLNDHADRLHGAPPESGSTTQANDMAEIPYGGQMHDLYSAIAEIELMYGHAIEALAHAAGRNTNVA